MNSDIEEIKSRLNIIDVLGEYIRLDKAGANYKARCPFHNEKSASFMVSEEKQIWHCFGCQKGGDVFGFVMEMEGLEFRDTLKLLADKAGVTLQKFNNQAEVKKSRTLEILELATKFYEVQLWQGAGKVKIINYLKERGLNEAAIKEFRLGYAPAGWRNVLEFLTKRGYSAMEIEKTGLLVQKSAEQSSNGTASHYDRFRDRIMFPIADTMGKILGYSARVAPGGDESQAKYVNTPESEVYHKSRVLYGLDRAKSEIKHADFVLLVEGNMDVIAASQAGIKNVVAVSGTALTQEQITMIKRYTENIRMFFDMDSAGENATKKSIKLCFGKEMNVRVVELPEGKDAADLAKSSPEKLLEAVEKAPGAMEYFFQKTFSKYDKEKVEDQKKITADLLDMISAMSSEIEKSHWVRKLSQELNLKEAILTDMLKKATFKDIITPSSRGLATAVAKSEPKNKLELLVQSVIGLALVFPEVWEAACVTEMANPVLQANDLMRMMLQKGRAVQFNFDNFVRTLESREAADEVRKIYSEKKYKIGLNNEIEEIILKSPKEEFERHIRDIQREAQRIELEKIEHDQKLAEERGDKEALNFLCQEARRISNSLASLN